MSDTHIIRNNISMSLNAVVCRAVSVVSNSDTFIAHAGQGECRQLAGLTAEAIVAAAQTSVPMASQQTL